MPYSQTQAPSSNHAASVTASVDRVAELEAENSRLREQLGRAKAVNDAMWEAVVQSQVAKVRTKESDGGGNEDVDMLKIVE